MVDFLIRRDKHRRIYFASLQSGFAQQFLPPEYRNQAEFDTIVYYAGGKFYARSSAVLRVLKLLDRFYLRWMVGFLIVPRFIRDAVYRVLARNRYRWYGRKETCRVPLPEEKAQFLDDFNSDSQEIVRASWIIQKPDTDLFPMWSPGKALKPEFIYYIRYDRKNWIIVLLDEQSTV